MNHVWFCFFCLKKIEAKHVMNQTKMWRMIIVSNYRSIKAGHSVTPFQVAFWKGNVPNVQGIPGWWNIIPFGQNQKLGGGNSNIFGMFTPKIGEDSFPFWRACFSRGIKTTNQKRVWICQSYLMLDAKGEMLRNFPHQIWGAVLQEWMQRIRVRVYLGGPGLTKKMKNGIPIKLHEKAFKNHVSKDFFRMDY